MSTPISRAEREALWALSVFRHANLMEGDERSLLGSTKVVRLVRWTEHASFPMPEKADVEVPGNPPIQGLMTRAGTRPPRGADGKPMVAGALGEHFAFMVTRERYADEFAALAVEFFRLLCLCNADGYEVDTFEALDAYLARRVDAMNEGIHEDQQVTLEDLAFKRDRWIEDIPDDSPGEGMKPAKWVRISDRVLDVLAELACSQSAALRRGVRVHEQSVHTFAGLQDQRATGELVHAAKVVTEGSPSAPVPVLRAMVPKGTQLLLPTSDHPDTQIGKDGSVPIDRVGNGQAFRAFLMFTDAYLQRPRDASGQRPATFEVNLTAMLEGYGLRGASVRKAMTGAIRTLQELKVRAVEVGGADGRRERWVVTGKDGEEAWEPLLTRYEKRIVGRDGKEYQSGPSRYLFAGTVLAALDDMSHCLQIPRASLGQEPETLLSLVGLATMHRAHISRTIKNQRKEYRLTDKRTLVEGCFRGSVAAGNTVDRQFERLRDLAEEHGYGRIMLTPSGEVIVTPDEWFLDVYARFEGAAERHARAYYAAKKKLRAK